MRNVGRFSQKAVDSFLVSARTHINNENSDYLEINKCCLLTKSNHVVFLRYDGSRWHLASSMKLLLTSCVDNLESSWFFKKDTMFNFFISIFLSLWAPKICIFPSKSSLHWELGSFTIALWAHSTLLCQRGRMSLFLPFCFFLIRTEMQSGCFQMFLINCPSISVKISRKSYIYMQYFQWQYFFE